MMIYECLMGATRVSIPLKHFNGVPKHENYTSDTDPRPLSVQCRRPHHPPDGCLITWKPLSNISESHGMEGSVSHALLSYDFEAAVFLDSSFCGHDPRRHVFSSDKLKSRTLFLPPVRPRPPPGAPKPTLLGRRAHASPGSRPLSSPWSVSHRAGSKGFAPSLRTRPLPGWGPFPHLCLTPVPNLSREAGSSVDPGRARPGHLSKPS